MECRILLALGLGLVGAMAVPSAHADSQAAPPARRTVYAWFPRDFNNRDTAAIDWSSLTHICYRSVVIQPRRSTSRKVRSGSPA